MAKNWPLDPLILILVFDLCIQIAIDLLESKNEWI